MGNPQTLSQGRQMLMSAQIDPRAGKVLDPASLLDVGRLLRAYYEGRPDPTAAEQRAFLKVFLIPNFAVNATVYDKLIRIMIIVAKDVPYTTDLSQLFMNVSVTLAMRTSER